MYDVKRMKNIREDNDITQKEMAKILNVSRSTYSLWELGINNPPLSSLFKFANYFNYSIDYIIGNSNDKKRKNSTKELDLKTLGKNIKRKRKDSNISQDDLAKLLSVTQPCIVRYEKGLIEISIYNLYMLSHYLNIQIE